MESLKILECENCGLVYLSSFDHVLDGFYENSGMFVNAQYPDPEEGLRHTEDDDERRYQYMKKLITNLNLLDFGCGGGGFLLKARNSAKQVFGLELETQLQPYYQSKKLTVFSNVDELLEKHTNMHFDLITMFHVLEHLPEPSDVLEQLASLLNVNGQLIIEVPNANDILLGLYKKKACLNYLYWSCHLYLYTPETLKLLAKKAGLTVNYVKQIQRYSLANHLHWLCKGKPGGHQKWSFLDSDELHVAYEKQLASIGACDTIVASLSKV